MTQNWTAYAIDQTCHGHSGSLHYGFTDRLVNLLFEFKQRSNTTEAFTALALKAQNSRAFRVWHDTAKGTMHFSIELPIEEGDLFEKGLNRPAECKSPDPTI